MIGEIISVGTEILMGQIVNTDAQYLAQVFSELGINLYHQTTVGDNMERLCEVIEMALSRSDLLVLSGGLGPTEDDMTKWAVAKVMDVEMVEDETSRKYIEGFFESWNRVPTPNNFRQAQFPRGCTILPNKNGTAPGCICEYKGKLIAILPGPPHELKGMMENSLRPVLEEKSNNCIQSKMLRVFGRGESAVEYELRDIIAAQTNPTIAPYASLGEVALRVTARIENGDDPEKKLMPVVNEILSRLGDEVYATDGRSMPKVVADLLLENHKTIAIAESMTGGKVSDMLVEIPGISKCFLEGVVTYSNESKIRLGVDANTISLYTAVSKEVALEMARAVRKRASADIGVATTGVAGPGADADGHPEGLLFVAIETEDGHKCFEYSNHGTRQRIRNMACLSTLDQVRKALLYGGAYFKIDENH